MSDGGARAGVHALARAADPINRSILRVALDRPVQTGPDDVYEITPSGREGLFVAFTIERWLQSFPRGSLEFDGEEAQAAVAGLGFGWATGVIHALAREPRTFSELRRATGLGRRALRRLLATMSEAGQVEVHAGTTRRGPLYSATDWLRAGVAPLAAAARVERRLEEDESPPIDALDVEAAFMLALPLLKLPAEVSGSCRLGVRLEEDLPAPVPDAAPDLTGVVARIDRGRVIACEPALDQRADARAVATASDWLDTVIEPDAKRVRTSGDRRLAALLLHRLHETLFGVMTRS